MTYKEEIEQIEYISFDSIRDISVRYVNSLTEEERELLWESLEHGVILLDSDAQMRQYLYSYGKMHQAKLKKALACLNLASFSSNDFDIVDWGCGQGIATMCMFDYLRAKNISNRVQNIILIEPSKAARERAEIHVKAYVDTKVNVRCVDKYLDDVTEQDIKTTSPDTFHFFSNILDISNINLKLLAEKVGMNVQGQHYIFCISPMNNGNPRLDRFYEYFNSPEVFMNEKKGEYNYPGGSRPCSYNIKVFKLENDQINVIAVDYFPDMQFYASSQLDSVRNVLKTDDEEFDAKVRGLYDYMSSFEVAAPFDIGAGVYDDVHPVLAVLHNIVVRGLPTKSSPFVEEAFANFGNQRKEDAYGSIYYENKELDTQDVFLALHAVDSRFGISEKNYNKKILGSDFEKTFITSEAPQVIRQLFQPQRSMTSITGDGKHHSQRVDFACQFPYPVKSADGKLYKGSVIELDGAKYHSDTKNRINDDERLRRLEQTGWKCVRLSDVHQAEPALAGLDNDYFAAVDKAYKKTFDESWIRTLQMTLSPIGVARVEKTILEALMTGRLDYNKSDWNILAIEHDVPCVAMAIRDLTLMFNKLTSLSQDYSGLKFPNVHLDVVSSKEFINSELHKYDDGVSSVEIRLFDDSNKIDASVQYDVVIDNAILRRAGLEEKKFSNFKCPSQCYFHIRSSHYLRGDRHIYTSDMITYRELVTKDIQGNYLDIQENKKLLQYFLQTLFRKKDFRSGQLAILSRAMMCKSVIGLLPTGGGKSLTYQLAAMLQPGVTIIVDPLRSLMADQYDGLIKMGVDTCTFINSTLNVQEKERRAIMMEESRIQFVFLSPERLCTYAFRQRLHNMHQLGVYFSYGVIDEVHCVSEWGHDFRFTYLHLGRNLYRYVLPKQTDKHNHLTLFGLTATASFDVLADVERELSGEGAFDLDSDTIIRDENTNRLELQYKIENVPIEYEDDPYYDQKGNLSEFNRAVKLPDKWTVYKSKIEFLRWYLDCIPGYIKELQEKDSIETIKKRFNERQNITGEIKTDLTTNLSGDFLKAKESYNQAGIVFCPHKENGLAVMQSRDALHGDVQDIGTFMGSGDGDDADEIDKESFKNLDLFRENKLPLMVATKAFGMGIDKPNVRFTVNMNYSSSLESFVQEAGRAGRDRKMALSTILFSDYRLVSIKRTCSFTRFPMMIIRGKWFREEDLREILDSFNINLNDDDFVYYTPDRDMVSLRCDVCHPRYAFKLCDSTCNSNKCSKGPCQVRCSEFERCQLRKVPDEARGFVYKDDLEDVLKENGLSISPRFYKYKNYDYETVMYFYNNNFKGTLIEMRTMMELLNDSDTDIFYGNDAEIKDTVSVRHFLQTILKAKVGTEIVALISAVSIYEANANGLTEKVRILKISKDRCAVRNIETQQEFLVDKKTLTPYREKSDIAKAIYRMCCIGLIDDFTEDYGKKAYRIVTKRKPDGSYYKALQTFLERYYTKEKAAEMAADIPASGGNDEVHNCLIYLTEFIYDKIAVKRKQAIDDIRSFCIEGTSYGNDWKRANEELKDFIYYYFNSKYARTDYKTENGEAFSLTDESDRGRKWSYDMLFKYMRVIDDDVVGTSSPTDNIKHLQGAVRLIRRAITENNPVLDFLNVFCLLYLKVGNNQNLQEELQNSYIRGYRTFYNSSKDKAEFYSIMDKFKENLTSKDRNVVSKSELKMLREWDMLSELDIHSDWLDSFKKKYADIN